MRRRHFEELRPVCPQCRADRGLDVPLVLAAVEREQGDIVVEGVLHCADPACWLEFPIIDGIPFLIANLRGFIADNITTLTARDDLSALIETMIGDGAGPGTHFDAVRQHLSIYGWDGYADLDPQESAPPAGAHPPGAVRRCLERGLDLLGTVPTGPALDFGCAVGRSSFVLAERTSGLVLGIDLNIAMLRLAQRILRQGEVSYPRRRVGIVYDRRRFAVDFAGAERVDFWLCDGLAPPFAAGGFGLAVGLNVLDCVRSPRDFLAAVRGQVREGGAAILASPYDWSPAATPIEAWIGGHSQRGPIAGASEPFLRTLLTAGAHPQSVAGLEWVAEDERFPWHARMHERSTMSYATHLVVARAGPAAG